MSHRFSDLGVQHLSCASMSMWIGRNLSKMNPPNLLVYVVYAIASISIGTPLGKAVTWTQERAGDGAGKNSS